MALYNLSVNCVSRGRGKSVVAAAAYRSGEKIYNEYNGKVHDYTRRNDVVYSAILLPNNAPHKYFTRSVLWNTVEKKERRIDARLARDIKLALPNELSLAEQVHLVNLFARENFLSEGLCVDIAIHDGINNHGKSNDPNCPNNPHAHILIPTRSVTSNGFSDKKNREVDKKEFLLLWRERWATAQNKEFERKGLEIRVSNASYATQGINRESTKHLGPAVSAMERRRIVTDRGNENRAIQARNLEREQRQKKNVRSHSKERGHELSR